VQDRAIIPHYDTARGPLEATAKLGAGAVLVEVCQQLIAVLGNQAINVGGVSGVICIDVL